MLNWPIAHGQAACCGFISNNAPCLIFTALDGEDFSHFNWTPAWQRLDVNSVESFSVKSSFLFFHIVLRVNLVNFNFWCETFICWSMWSSVLILHMSPQHCWELKWVLVSCLFQSRSRHLRENSQCWKAKMNVKRMFPHILTALHLYTSLKGNLRWNVCRCHGHCQFHLKPMQFCWIIGSRLFPSRCLWLWEDMRLNQWKHLFTENIGIGNFVVCGNYCILRRSQKVHLLILMLFQTFCGRCLAECSC